MKSNGYSLWILPTGEANKKFSDFVKKLAEEHQAPLFQPHVTLLGDFLYPEEESIELTKQLVTGQKPFTIEMEQIDYEDYFFRTLFVRAKKTPELLALNTRARDIFQMNGTLDFMPHLSLLYGMFPVDTKEKIIKEIGRDQSIKFEISSVHLLAGGEIEDWRIVGEFPLK